MNLFLYLVNIIKFNRSDSNLKSFEKNRTDWIITNKKKINEKKKKIKIN